MDAKPAIPPKNPCPNSRPNRPAPRKPAARPPSNPLPKNPGRADAWPTVPALLGCVTLRCMGAAVFGAVRVAGGAEKVLMPRLPPENPPPARALASAATSTSAAAIAASAIRKRCRNIAWSPPEDGAHTICMDGLICKGRNACNIAANLRRRDHGNVCAAQEHAADQRLLLIERGERL